MEGSTIRLNGHEVHPSTQQAGGHHFSQDASESSYVRFQKVYPSTDSSDEVQIVIQCVNFLSPAQKDELSGLCVNVLSYAAENTYFCRFEPAELDEIRALPYIVYANVYHPGFVIGPKLKEQASSNGKDFVHGVQIIPHEDHIDHIDKLRQKIVDELKVDPNDVTTKTYSLQANVSADQIRSIAKLDEVQIVKDVKPRTFDSNCAYVDLNSNLEPIPGFGLPLPAIGRGHGEIIAIHDSGLDDLHVAFNGRILHPIISYRAVPGHDDTVGHGTHVAGCALGFSMTTDFGGNVDIPGSAPEASLLAMASALDAHGGPGQTIWPQVLTDAFDRGARIMNNSSSSGPGALFEQYDYTDGDTPAIDRTIRDSEMVFVQSAGNSGSRKFIVPQPNPNEIGEVGAENVAKNSITVGACESSRHMGLGLNPLWPSRLRDYAYDPLQPQGNINRWATFSSTGPVKDTQRNTTDATGAPITTRGRTKPDVLAPGTAIYAAKSSVEQPYPWYPGATTDGNYRFYNGTSHATPLVAGCCAVIRGKIREKCGQALPRIPNVLVKAVLINGATPLPAVGQHYPNNGFPSDFQGFGRVNVAKSLICLQDTLPGCGFWPSTTRQADTRVAQGNMLFGLGGIRVRVDPPVAYQSHLHFMPAKTLTVAMCFNDWSDNLARIVDCYVLQVNGPAGAPRRDDTVTPDGETDNNVQRIIWRNIPPGDYFINVRALRVSKPAFAQPIAIAWHTEETGPNGTYAALNARMPSNEARQRVEVLAPAVAANQRAIMVP